MYPTQIMCSWPFYFFVWKIPRQLETRSRCRSLGTCHCQHQHRYVLGAGSQWGVLVLEWWNSAERQAAHLAPGSSPSEWKETREQVVHGGYNLHSWKYSKSDWTSPLVICCSWTLFELGGELHNFKKSLPTSTIPWCYDICFPAFPT